MSYELNGRPLGDDPWSADPWNAMECMSRGPGWTWSNGQCVQAATGGWGEVACKASGGTWDAIHGACCPAGQVPGASGCETPSVQAPPVASWELAACSVFGGMWDAASGTCFYPPSSEGLVASSRGSCPAGSVQASGGKCMTVSPRAEPQTSPQVSEQSWWQRQPDSTKLFVIAGAGAAGLVLFAVVTGAFVRERTPNPTRRRRRR
jgi:hypothetical protein